MDFINSKYLTTTDYSTLTCGNFITSCIPYPNDYLLNSTSSLANNITIDNELRINVKNHKLLLNFKL